MLSPPGVLNSLDWHAAWHRKHLSAPQENLRRSPWPTTCQCSSHAPGPLPSNGLGHTCPLPWLSTTGTCHMFTSMSIASDAEKVLDILAHQLN